MARWMTIYVSSQALRKIHGQRQGSNKMPPILGGIKNANIYIYNNIYIYIHTYIYIKFEGFSLKVHYMWYIAGCQTFEK